MNNPIANLKQRDESPSAIQPLFKDNASMFELLFERNIDAIILFDPQLGVFVDCNQALVDLMGADSKEQFLQRRPEDFSPPVQPNGQSSYEMTVEVLALVEKNGSHRFEWIGRRFDGREVPMEVAVTSVQVEGRRVNVSVVRDITERKRTEAALRESEQKFRGLFEASSDGIIILDAATRLHLDCNDAAVRMAGGGSREWFLSQSIDTLSPERQPDGRSSSEVARAWIERTLANGPQRFEWMAKGCHGNLIPVEVLLSPLCLSGRQLLVAVSRDISERKKTERELLDLNQSLERRVAERTAALTTSEARFRALVEHAPEAIVVFNGDTEQFLFGNEHAGLIYGVPMAKLTDLTPADVSPEFQPDGRRSNELARKLMDEALAGGTPVFEWIHRQPDGKLIPTEVRLLRLPAEGQNLVRASIIDNTERKRAERALRESEEKFRALFEGSSQGVILHDEHQFLEVNPAAVRIMGCQSPQELLGKYPADASPPFQPNGESSAELTQKYVKECMTNGSARFEWMSCTPQGKDVPLEVTLTRIEWSGRQVIQALLNDIRERKQAEGELRASEARLRESEARFSAAFQASPVLIAIGRVSDKRFVLVNDAFVRWTGYSREEILGRTTAELNIWERPKDREEHWAELHRTGLIGERECRFRDRSGKSFTMLLSTKIIQLNDVPHTLSMGVDITERKRAQVELAESEARFSAAFQASPIFIAIARMNDGRFVLANDAFVNWTGYTREEVLGRSTAELKVWESQEDREAFWAELRRTGVIRDKECRFRNQNGRPFTMLLSSEIIQLNHVPHMLSMALDITGRKQTEAELQASEARLRESEARFSAAFQASPVFISIMRMGDEKYVLTNDAFVNWLGFTRDEVIGQSSAELGVWEKLAERDLIWKELRQSGSARQKEVRWRNRNGTLFTILLSAEVITVDNAPHILSLAQDITQRKQAEVEMLKALAREKELSQLKSNFVSMVSHEFRTPLGIIQSSAELLRDFYQKMPSDDRNEQLESITRNTRRMAGMMEEILFLSRLDADKLDFQPAKLDLNAFCRRVLDEVLSATNRRCHIELLLGRVPEEAEADERLLGHIFTNLLSNAVKYSEPGSTVYFMVEPDGPEAVCTIRDQGIGISGEDQQHLFKAFHRGSNVGTRPGTGLGLLLVKRCVDLHGGKVQLCSRIGEGTTVTLRLNVFGRNHEKNIDN